MVLEIHIKLFMTDIDFLKSVFAHKFVGNGPKIGFLECFEKF